MRNADEHKKLLAQIAELEKNSVNYFDVEKEFFIIDSNNLSQIRPKLYGYSIQATGIYEDDNLTPEAVANLDGRGCYVYVEVRDGKITIKQDLNGCWGIYLFQHGDYFAVSNSFFRLLDHIKYRYPLTVNRDYCHYFLLNDLCSHTYSETAINEIRLVERNAILHIDTIRKNFEIELIDYKEHTILPDSEEAIAILDSWSDFWSSILREIANRTKFITADLSGGFDSRISFIPLLQSRINLDNIKINSNNDGLGVHKEDYDIASKIAVHYGFKLNQSFPKREFLNYSINDVWNLDIYHQQTIHIIPSIPLTKKNVEKIYYFRGYAGEIIRNYWHNSPKTFVENELKKTNNYSLDLSFDLSDSIKNILESGIQAVCSKNNIKDTNSTDIPQYLYQETRCRHHFGKETVGLYLKNVIVIAPLLDPELLTLKLYTQKCSDPNLMLALLFVRFAPDLLKFPFQGKRSIAPETIAYAQKINERFPRRVTADKLSGGGRVFHLQPLDLQAEKILAEGKNNPSIPRDLPEDCLKATFELSKTYSLFTAYFDKELYDYAAVYYDNHLLRRNRPMYAVCSIARALENVKISQSSHLSSFDLKRLLEEEYCRINDDAQIIEKFKNYFTARIDIKFTTKGAGDFQILSVSDGKANIKKSNWLQKNESGYYVQSYAGELEIVIKANANGQLQVRLMGPWVPNQGNKSKLIPYWIDYTKLTINGKIILDALTPAWHNKAYIYDVYAKANDEIKIQVEWLPHRSS